MKVVLLIHINRTITPRFCGYISEQANRVGFLSKAGCRNRIISAVCGDFCRYGKQNLTGGKMPKIDITKIIYVCDSCNKHFTDNSGSVLTFESSNKKIILCDECTRDLSEGLERFINKEKNDETLSV